MGFIDALYALGRRELERSGSGEFADVDSFCQMPMDLIESDEESARRLPGKELQVWLDVPDPKAECLDVRGIRKIEVADFWGGGGDDRAKKRRYLYRDPVSPAAAWRYSPLYKLGGGVANGRQALVGDGDWRNNKELRFFKLYNSMLRAFEEQGVFSPGSVDRIMEALVERVERLAELWSDKKRSYLLIFGASDTERFYYPVDTPAFLAHFRTRLAGVSGAEPKPAKNKKNRQQHSVSCGVCHESTSAPVNLDKVFAFATFDKKSFLPGVEDGDASRAKVFPLCGDCYRILSEGRNVIDTKFLDAKSVYNVRIYTVPELLMGNVNRGHLEQKTKDFLRTGLQNAPFLAERVLEQEDSLTYHFVFWEQNQAQERLLLMVEDVPPSRLRRLGDLWRQTVSATGLFARKGRFAPETDEAGADPNAATLYQGIRTIMGTLTGLAGKNDGDAAVLRDWLLGLIGRLLSGERVDVERVKGAVVSRLQGLCADSDWVARYGVAAARRWNAIVDFLYRANELTKNVQSVPDGGERQNRKKG